MATAADLAADLLDIVEEHLTALERGPLRGFDLPRLLLGHPVGPDVRADLAFTLSLFGVARPSVGGLAVDDALLGVLARVDGRRTHTFYSYRVAESALRYGVERLPDDALARVIEAADSTAFVAALDDGRLPRNYAAVLARCEHSRRELGVATDSGLYDRLVRAVGELLTENPYGYLDDTTSRAGRYDVYTADVYLFTEPLAAELGPAWRRGAARVLGLVERVVASNGAAVTWGRSSGALAICHTIELGALALRHGLVDEPGPWLALAATGARSVRSWFRDGWITAHQHRSPERYRGIDRRLQMTLDCLGKLADAAVSILAADGEATVADAPAPAARDEMVPLEDERPAAVWTYRSDRLAFVMPLVGTTTTDYLPAPRNPGLFEVPIDSALSTATPMVLHRGVRYAGGGVPIDASHTPGRLRVQWAGFPEAGQLDPGESPRVFPGSRSVSCSVEGRTLAFDEHLVFDESPHAVGLQVTETADRPLVVRFTTPHPHTVASLDVDGISEYRSCWGVLPRLHQVDLEPAHDIRFRWEVTPALRVVSTAAGHHYDHSLYSPLGERVRVARLPHSATVDRNRLRTLLDGTDVFHMHWPEWVAAGDVATHEMLVDGISRAGVPIVWTQHNLEPHRKDDSAAVYPIWAEAASVVVHHSEYGRERALARYRYGAGTRHAVIRHGHFGGLSEGFAPQRDPSVIRIGIVGAPRQDKDIALAMRAMARCSRPDAELVVLSLGGDEVVPDDPRIVARRYEFVDRATYDADLSRMDALLMPFDPDGAMITTGTVGDAVAFGLPVICSEWGYLVEELGDAGIVYGRSEDDLVACLDRLDRSTLDTSAAAMRAIRPSRDWSVLAEEFFALIDELPSPHI